MSDWYDDKNFSGTDWDGDGIDWYDYEFDREVYRSSFGSGHRPGKKSSMSTGGVVALIVLVLLFILGICIPEVGAVLVILAWLTGFVALINMVFH